MMKNKIFITALLSAISSFLWGQNLTFKDKNLEKAVLENFDINKDGGLNQQEANLISNLFLVKKGITLTDDLSFFKNATMIVLDDNTFQNVTINNFNQLELFSCTNCKISTFKTENLKNLTSLYLDNNVIENISFKTTPRINQLTLSLNKLKTIDVSSLKNLKNLNVEHNQIQKLDISGNPDLQTLNIGGNKMKETDIKKGIKADVTIYGAEQ